MSRDSFVCLSSSEEFMKNYDLPNLKEHQSSIYYQIAILCIVQRASVLKFSAEIASIAEITQLESENSAEKIENIYANYIEFLNKIYFREITSQIQGIEIYNKFQKVMNIHIDVKDLDNEIKELNRFVGLIYQRKESRETNKHTWLATFFLPAMLISGILGMNVYNNSEEVPEYFVGGGIVWSFWIPTIGILGLTIIGMKRKKIWIFLKKIFNKKN